MTQEHPGIEAVQVRFLTVAAQMPGAVIVAVGDGTQEWSAQARVLAPVCRVEMAGEPAGIAAWLAEQSIAQIFLLHLAGDQALPALNGLARHLSYSRIDAIWLSGIDPRAALPAIAAKLTPHGYRLFGVEDDGERMTELRSWIDGRGYHRFMAINQRVLGLLLQNDHSSLDLGSLCQRHGIAITGLVHLGAHEGQELGGYRAIGSFPVAFIEAHPDVFSRLATQMAGKQNVTVIHAAVSDREGPVTLHVSADDQSSSVLPLAGIERLLPTTAESGTIEVPGRTLDSLMAGLRAQGNPVAQANLLVSDIQGAELLALKGAAATLPQFDGIVLELSFDELYAGGAQVEEIDDFMGAQGFTRVATISAWHPSWSDAFYVRQRS